MLPSDQNSAASSPQPSSGTDPAAPNGTRFVFPHWANYLLPAIVLAIIGGGIYVPTLFGYGASPDTLAVGYAPTQPIPYSHAMHAGQLGLDCRYCHTTVEKAAFAALPPTQTCMNCHTGIRIDSPRLAPLRESWTSGRPVEWVRVHSLPQYVYFNHSAHVAHGVGCEECHGRIDHMDVVQQFKPLSMGWCLECHRDPAPHLRPPEMVTKMGWSAAVNDPEGFQKAGGTPEAYAQMMKTNNKIHDTPYMQSCSTCHR